MDARQVIIEPVVSEKSYALMADGKYTFRVDHRAHKTQIRQAIEELESMCQRQGLGLPRANIDLLNAWENNRARPRPQTIDLLASYTPTPDNRFTLKVINNDLQADLAARSSLNDFRTNPYQRGCAAAATAATGCTPRQPRAGD